VSRAFDGYLNRLKTPTMHIPPCYRNYDEANICCMLERWTKMQRQHWPSWLYSGEFQTVVDNYSLNECKQLFEVMSHTRSTFDSDDEVEIEMPSDNRRCIALLRLRFGEMVEEDMCRQWSVGVSNRVLYSSISSAAAVWTSTHAEYLLTQSADHTYVDKPSLHLIPSEFNDPDLSEFITSVSCMNDCGNGAKRTHLVFQLLQRSLNTANRGWTSSSIQLLNLKGCTGSGLRELVQHALLVTLTGLHSCIDPPARPTWKDRQTIYHIFRQKLNITNISNTHSNLIKQSVRRLLISTYSGNLVARNDQNERRRTENAFQSPPENLASNRCRMMMSIITQQANDLSFDEFMKTIEYSTSEIVNSRMWTSSEEWPWNGKAGTIQTANMLKSHALNAFVEAHNKIFEPFWYVSYQNSIRASRLDASQYDAFCEINEAIQRTRGQCDAVEKALCRPLAHRMSLEQTFALFGHNAPLTSASSKQASVFQNVPPETSTAILAFARASNFLEQLITYDYSDETRLQQEAAVHERYVGSTDSMTQNQIRTKIASLPHYTTRLCICTECHRVANAFSPHNAKEEGTSFTEVGIASCIACLNEQTGYDTLRCAKRLSAATRTAMVAEEFASNNAIDRKNKSWDIELDNYFNQTHDLKKAELQYMRRDSRRTYEQTRQSKLCGENHLVGINLIGKLVKVYGTWYTLCCYCGCLISNVNARTNVDGKPSCMRCGHLVYTKKSKKTATPIEHCCRYCHIRKTDLVPYFSPFDEKYNIDVPPELRVTFWCSKHRPSWLQQSLISGLYDDNEPVYMSEIISRIANHVAPRAL